MHSGPPRDGRLREEPLRRIQSDMATKSDTDIPKWVLSPAKYLAPSTPEVAAKTMDEVEAFGLDHLEICYFFTNL